jgi:hypothetical protein
MFVRIVICNKDYYIAKLCPAGSEAKPVSDSMRDGVLSLGLYSRANYRRRQD